MTSLRESKSVSFKKILNVKFRIDGTVEQQDILTQTIAARLLIILLSH